MAAAPRLRRGAGIEQLVISVDPGSRDSARFFARLGFVPLAVRRTAPVASSVGSCHRALLDSACDRARTRPLEAAAARRALAGLPRVLRPTGRELQHHRRPADQRGLRVHRDAHQRPAGRGADPRRGQLRHLAKQLPARRLRRVQGRPRGDARRLQGPGVTGPRGARRAADPGGLRRGLRSRRRAGDPCHAGGRRRHGRADRHR